MLFFLVAHGVDSLPHVGWTVCLIWGGQSASCGVDSLPHVGWTVCLMWGEQSASWGWTVCLKCGGHSASCGVDSLPHKFIFYFSVFNCISWDLKQQTLTAAAVFMQCCIFISASLVLCLPKRLSREYCDNISASI